MVRETRHLWVGNLPDNIREDRIREHFKRYGRVQNVKLLGRTETSGGSLGAMVASNAGGGLCATVAFMDIKSASKAHNVEHVLDERTLTTEYYEPAAIPSAAGAPSAGSSPAGSGYSGSSSSVNSTPAPTGASGTPAASASRYHLSGGEENGNGASSGGVCSVAASAAAPVMWRGTNDSATDFTRRGSTPGSYTRYSRGAAPYSTPPSVDRTPHHRWYSGGSSSNVGSESGPGTPVCNLGEGGEGGEGGAGARRRSGSGGSSRSSSTSGEPSSDSRASTPTASAVAPVTAAASNAGPSASHRPVAHQWAATASGRPLAICIRNLPTRSTDSSLKDGLYHEYKKHGKVVWVKVVGQNADRYAVVRFKKPSDVEKAIEVSQDKLFFGCKISVAPHQSCDEDAESAKPYETDIDEYHPKATRTLFIGNLEKDVTQQQLRDKFKHFGRIIEIDIKKGSGANGNASVGGSTPASGNGAGYAFCQYASISSVVDAIRAMDGEYVGGSRVKLGFGKPVATTCVWVDGLTEHTEKQVLSAVSRCGAALSVCVDRAAGAALVHFEQASAASAAVRELRRVASLAALDPLEPPPQRRLMVDYASRECQEAFYEQLEKHGGSAALAGSERLGGDAAARYVPTARHDTIRYENCGSRSRGSSYGRGSSRTPRYTTLDHYDPAEYAADRRYRVFDEIGSSPQTEESPYEEKLQSVVVSPVRTRRHRRDSTPDDHKHPKEKHRPSIVRRSSGDLRHRSRSGSRSEHRRRGSDAERKRHRRRRDESGSRAGTPLCDELPEGPMPTEPRRPPQPRDRSQYPMSLPLPKFAAQVLRSVASNAATNTPAPAPASPSRPPSVSSSSGGSAPHSPSLEERIKSLDEKYEKWSGSRVSATEAADRGRFRHRLLEIDINEVKPSEVVRSLLAKRSVFDEDSERLEGAVSHRPPSPESSPLRRSKPRALQYPFPSHPNPVNSGHSVDGLSDTEDRILVNGISDKGARERHIEYNKTNNKVGDDDGVNIETKARHTVEFYNDKLADPRLNRPEKVSVFNRETRLDEDYKHESLRNNANVCISDKNYTDSFQKNMSKHDHLPNNIENNDKIKQEGPIKKENNNKLFSVVKHEGIEEHTDQNTDYKSEKLVYDTDFVQKWMSDEVKPFTLTTKNIKLELNAKTGFTDDLKSGNQNNLDYFDTKNSVENLNKIEDRSDGPEQENVHNLGELKLDLLEQKLMQLEDSRKDKKQVTGPQLEEKLFSEVSLGSEEIQNEIKKDNLMVEDNKNITDYEESTKDIDSSSKEFNLSTSNQKRNMDMNFQDELKIEKRPSKEDLTETEKLKEKRCFNYKGLDDHQKSHNHELIDVQEKRTNQKDKLERIKNDERHSKDKNKSVKHDKEKIDKDKKVKEHSDRLDKGKHERDKQEKELNKAEKDTEKLHRDDKSKQLEDRSPRLNEHKKEKIEKDRRKDSIEKCDLNQRHKKDDRHKHERNRKEDTKKDNKKDHDKSRKSSRDESTREFIRKDSTDSSASRTSHDSSKVKEIDNDLKLDKSHDVKEDSKLKSRHENYNSLKSGKDFLVKNDHLKFNVSNKIKDDKEISDSNLKTKTDNRFEHNPKSKQEPIEKQRHYSVDSPNLDSKRKERLNSCSSLPSHIGHKRRMSSQDSIDIISDEVKKNRNNEKSGHKISDRRDSKDSKNNDRHKPPKFSKGHFAKLIENKTKEHKNNQVKPPDDILNKWDTCHNELSSDKNKSNKRSPNPNESISTNNDHVKSDGLQNDLQFLAILELRSSEEDEKQKALRKEMKEKKRIQQLQQIQELQMQQDALQQAEMLKMKEDRKHKSDEKKRDIAREKRISTDRRSRDEKVDIKRRNRKSNNINSSDTSDSDEPKKHSIFDIVDDGPTYISMYDKVKARSCKNMQKQEEEKRQEKIKAKFSQLKQSRAKREEKKRSSWDEDSDSDHDRKKKTMDSSSDEGSTFNINDKSNHDCKYSSTKNIEKLGISLHEDDNKNKLCRKNSRTRIMSDSSDDDTMQIDNNEFSKNRYSDHDSNKSSNKEIGYEKYIKREEFKKNNEFYDKKNNKSNYFDLKSATTFKYSSETDTDCKNHYFKTCDLSSESESITSQRFSNDYRKKHKKKIKKEKLSNSEDEKVERDLDKYKYGEDKIRKHSNKKEKRREKSRDFNDDELQFRKNRNNLESRAEIFPHSFKKEGKMEDIFGPLSDESDSTNKISLENKSDCSSHQYGSNDQLDSIAHNELTKQGKEDLRRKRDKKRRDKKHVIKEDENSLDVDAVGKAIEARLFADSINDDESRNGKHESSKQCKEMYQFNDHNEKLKRDSREKKKKKKKNKEFRELKKDHSFYHNNLEKLNQMKHFEPQKKSLFENKETPNLEKEESKSLLVSASLPRLTESPPLAVSLSDSKNSKIVPFSLTSNKSDAIDVSFDKENIEHLCEVKANESNLTVTSTESSNVPESKAESESTAFTSDFDTTVSEKAVRSISEFDKENEKSNNPHLLPTKIDEKLDEKPRAVISQEETEDAVAALLGESFGGNDDSFGNCFNESDDRRTENVDNAALENENIPEEDAEEMRQAVQNLNACELELKPDTPLSDNDLFIDTDTEEVDEAQDAIDKLPINIIATNPLLNEVSDKLITNNVDDIHHQKQLSTANIHTIDHIKIGVVKNKTKDNSASAISVKQDAVHQITSTATPVITSWAVSNKIREPHILNVQANQIANKDTVDSKPTHVSANIVQIKPGTLSLGSSPRPVITTTRMNVPYQVINQVVRPSQPMQPPTIKIPDPHILYQKQQGIVISPRLGNDNRMQSPKISPKGEEVTSPRLTNMTILSTSPQNVGLTSPAVQQRSPGHVTVVRMQQPPLSPIQTMHIPHGARAMVSPNRSNSVLVQTQGAPIHYNRLPVAPVLTPLSKPNTSIITQCKTINVASPTIIHPSKIMTGENWRGESRSNEGAIESPKIILSPTNMHQNTTNQTVMAQNRLISMQKNIPVGNINTNLHISNKVLISNSNEKREAYCITNEKAVGEHKTVPFGSSNLIHVSGINQTAGTIVNHIRTLSEPNSNSRAHLPNVIQTISTQRIMSGSPVANLLQNDDKRLPILTTIKTPTVLTKMSSTTTAVTNTTLSSVVMTPVLLKTNNHPPNNSRLDGKPNVESITVVPLSIRKESRDNEKICEPAIYENQKVSSIKIDPVDKRKELFIKPMKLTTPAIENITKCETDFEELLKDNTNEIKVTNTPDKKLEVNVGKTVTLISSNTIKEEATVCIKTSESFAQEKLIQDENSKCADHDTLNTEKEVKVETHLIAKEKDLTPLMIENDNSLTNVCVENAQEIPDVLKCENVEKPVISSQNENTNDLSNSKIVEDNDNWTAKDINIESVIKKVDSLCNEPSNDNKVGVIMNHSIDLDVDASKNSQTFDVDNNIEVSDINNSDRSSNNNLSKRGGRSVRGRKNDKSKDRVQTRQISKGNRGGALATKRGRGRGKMDKALKNVYNASQNNLPGDIYDFHEDSGEEETTSPSKSETRPRLILTIKSPLSGNSTAIPTSSLSIATRDQIKFSEKSPVRNKEEKPEDFVSPSTNTRKSRRLQEKDGNRNTVDDVIDDVIKNASTPTKINKDVNKKTPRPTRQTGKLNYCDKPNDSKKSPRAVKRARDRSLSDASVDSNDEKKIDEVPREAKQMKLTETTITIPKSELDASDNKTSSCSVISTQSSSTTTIPIMKPPKKMISEISAKLASSMEMTSSPSIKNIITSNVADKGLEDSVYVIKGGVPEPEKQIYREYRNIDCVKGPSSSEEILAAATAEVPADSHVNEMGFVRRLVDSVPGNMMLVGAMEATDARVQSPALPHRPPSIHRPADRATPVLIRAGECSPGMAGGAGGSRANRAPYAATPSLPRGAHHPPPPPPPVHLPHHPHLAVVDPHYHHTGARVNITSVPAISPQGQIGVGDGMYPHFSHHHYQMYQKHFHATQHDSRATASPFTRVMEAEGSEASTPPLELRRLPSSARVPRPAHSPSPADRLISTHGYGGRSPPPAHGRSPPPAHGGGLSAGRLPPALPPLGPPGPPHASQVPREADSLQMLLRRYPVMWQGLLALKNDAAAVQMHFVHGNGAVAGSTLVRHADGSTAPLRIAQRMRLEPQQLDQVHRKMKMENEHCMLLALPCGRDHMDVLQQSTNLTAGFITYLQRKQAAGIVNVAPPGHQQAMYTVHIFPSCDFANENLNRIAPDLMHRVADIAHLLIVIATV